jgi:S1-C subfamily serine protease
MEDLLLIDATERYLNGEMNDSERTYFEEIRKSNPAVDQLVVEHLYFLTQLNKFSETKQLQEVLQETKTKLIEEGTINSGFNSGKLNVPQLWNRYKRTIAVAASIAVIVSVVCASIISVFSHSKQSNIKPLVEKLKEQDDKYKKLERQIGKLNTEANQADNNTKPRLESKFRATGFMIDVNNNFIVTNAHVVSEAKNQLIVENNKGEQFYAESAYINTENDLAIIKITDPSFKKLGPIPYSIKKSNADLGDQVFTLGYPKQEIVYGEGYISAKNGHDMDTVYCQLSTLANEGNSGSPVINKNGELIGVLSSKEAESEGVVYAIKSSNILNALNEMKKVKENGTIKINSNQILRKSDRVTQIKKIQDYVFMIKGN